MIGRKIAVKRSEKASSVDGEGAGDLLLEVHEKEV
jgi:hypothetical protein